jgi:predicted amidohydrolase
MASGKLKVALVQQDTAWHDPAANLDRAARWIASAAAAGARVVAFPELFSTGFTMGPEPFAEAIPGPTTERLAHEARAHGVWVVGSAVEAHAPRPRNAAFALRPDGTLAAVYRKIHPFSFGDENRHYVGGGDCPVFDLDGAPAALQVCYDLRFPETFRALASRGVKLAFVLANWPSRRAAHWSTLLAARAIENQMAVCGVNRVGSDPHVDYPGLSAVHDARGEVLAWGGAAEQLVVADVDLADVDAWRAQFPALRDRRPDVYARLVP